MPEDDINWLACAHDALRHFPVSPIDVKLVSKSENIAFRVDAKDSKRYVLRIHRPGYHTLDELVSEQLWTEALLRDGVDVPVAVKTTEGERYTQVSVNGHNRNAGLLEWVDGKSLGELSQGDDQSLSREQAYQDVGRLLAILHEQAATWDPPEGFTRHAFDADGLMGEQPFWGRFWEAADLNPKQRKQAASMRERLYELLLKLPKDRQVYSMIHADLHTANLIAHGDNIHIIDFDDAGFGWHCYDFAVALSHFSDEGERGALQQAMFRGYERQRQLEPWVKELVPLFSLIRLLAMIGWLDARPDMNADRRRCGDLCNMAASQFHSVIAGINVGA